MKMNNLENINNTTETKEEEVGTSVENFNESVVEAIGEIKEVVDSAEKDISERLVSNPEDFNFLHNRLKSVKEGSLRSLKKVLLTLAAAGFMHNAAASNAESAPANLDLSTTEATEISASQESSVDEKTKVLNQEDFTSSQNESLDTEPDPDADLESAEGDKEVRYEYQTTFNPDSGSVEVTQITTEDVYTDYENLSDEEKKMLDDTSHGLGDRFMKSEKNETVNKKTLELVYLGGNHQYTLENMQVTPGSLTVEIKSTHALYDKSQVALDHVREMFRDGSIKTLDSQSQVRVKVLGVDGEEVYTSIVSKDGPQVFPKSVDVETLF